MLPDWSENLRNCYWNLRYAKGRNMARVRKEYRRIFAEKQRLIAMGIDEEEIRLLCRYLANLHDRHAESRWKAYAGQLRLPL